VLLQKNHCSHTKSGQKTLEEMLENARGTLEKRSRYRTALRLDVFNQPILMVVWPTRNGLRGLAQAWVCVPGVPKGKR
jgi:hypothetical protein